MEISSIARCWTVTALLKEQLYKATVNEVMGVLARGDDGRHKLTQLKLAFNIKVPTDLFGWVYSGEHGERQWPNFAIKYAVATSARKGARSD